VSAAALVTPVLAPARAAAALERLADRERDWDEPAAAAAERLDLAPLAERIAGRDAAVLLIAGAKDRVVSSLEVTELRDRLREHGLNAVEAATFRMGHAMAAQPGVDAQPPTTEAVRVDGVLNDWFRERLAEVEVTDPGPGAEEAHTDSATAGPAGTEPFAAEPAAPGSAAMGPVGTDPAAAEPAARASETVTQPFTRPAGGSMTGTGPGLDAGADPGHGLRPAPAPAPGSGTGSGTGSALGRGFGTVRSPMGEYPADLSQAGLGCPN
jgi:hypothetical protein